MLYIDLKVKLYWMAIHVFSVSSIWRVNCRLKIQINKNKNNYIKLKENIFSRTPLLSRWHKCTHIVAPFTWSNHHLHCFMHKHERNELPLQLIYTNELQLLTEQPEWPYNQVKMLWKNNRFFLFCQSIRRRFEIQLNMPGHPARGTKIYSTMG